MPVRKILTGWILMLALALAGARGQKSPSPTPAPSSAGLLLGYVSHHRNSEISNLPSVFEYKTLLIVRDGSGTRIVATLEDIIVPRKSGFWRIGIAHTCQLTPPSSNNPQDHGFINTQDVVYAVPVDKPPVVELQAPACDANTTKRLLSDSYDPNAESDAQPSNPSPPSECGWLDLGLESVLPDLISISGEQGDYCEARGGHQYTDMWVQSPDDPIAPFQNWFDSQIPSKIKIPFDRVFGATGHTAWIQAVSPLDPGAGSCPDDSDLNDKTQTGWVLRHSHVEWRTAAYVEITGFCEGSGDPKIPVPRSLTHATPLPIPWSALQKQLPGISDAYFPPGSSVVLAVQSSQDSSPQTSQITAVALYDFSGVKLGQKLLDLPTGNIISAEWATGRFVKNWADSLSALQTHGLPPATLKVRDGAN